MTHPARLLFVGAGAIGASTAALLHRSGTPCHLVARGEALAALADGVEVRTPGGGFRVKVPVAGSLAAWAPTPADLVVVATMGQHTAAAVEGLAADVPVLSLQNGLAPLELLRERGHLVIAGMVYVPAERRGPATVALPGAPVPGAFLLGEWPGGRTDGREARGPAWTAWLTERLARAGCRAEAEPEIAPWIRGKLLVNLGGIVVALCDEPPGDVIAAAQAEARAVWTAGGERFVEVATLLDRVGPLETALVDGQARVGGSTRAALARMTVGGELETATLHGDVVAAGRQRGIPTPVNTALITIAAAAARERWAPGSVSAGDLKGRVGLGG